jgi:hypothetical protein
MNNIPISFMKQITLFPHDILYHIFTFDTRFVLQNNKWIFINKIPKDDFRYYVLQKRIIITFRENSFDGFERSTILVKQHKNVFSIVLYNIHFNTDIEFSHYLYKTIQMYQFY